jgi:VWA domain containing CoxE-like protein
MSDPTPPDAELRAQRQVVFWRLLASVFGLDEQGGNVEQLTKQIVEHHQMPTLITDPLLSIDTLLQRHPELKDDFNSLKEVCGPRAEEEDANQPTPAPAAALDDELQPTHLRRTLAYSKLLLNMFGPNAQVPSVTAQGYGQWCRDVAAFEECFGYAPGSLRGKRGGVGGGASGQKGSTWGTGRGRLLSEERLQAGLAAMEGDLIRRMALREVLQDDRMAAQLTPSLPLLEQLLHDKGNLSGKALNNAKSLIKRYVDEVAEVLRTQVMQAVKGRLDRVPPKRSFRNLDLKRTIWKNLTRYNPNDGRLYVDQLHYRRAASKSLPKRMIVVVDQSGSMVDAMVQCTILASIFAGLPRVDVHLLAFDTRTIDLTEWVHDPFEVLLRTNLGGGTLIREALRFAEEKIEEPRNTTLVLISDFFEGGSNQVLLDAIVAIKNSGVRFIPVGAVTTSGYYSVCEFFRTRLKELGTPILSGSIKTLISELKSIL